MKFKKENIPNILTILRILLFPIVVFFIFFKIDTLNISYQINDYLVLIPTNIWISGIIFVIASLTDALDGYLARKKNWISNFGKIWDPISDKLLINSTLISLSIIGYIPFYITIIMISRDLIVDGYRIIAIKNGIDVSAGVFGKLKTIFQMIGIIVIFFVFANNEFIYNIPGISKYWQFYILQNGFIFIALFFSLLSMVKYIKYFSKSNKNI